jgi:hypothetical protein
MSNDKNNKSYLEAIYLDLAGIFIDIISQEVSLRGLQTMCTFAQIGRNTAELVASFGWLRCIGTYQSGAAWETEYLLDIMIPNLQNPLLIYFQFTRLDSFH